MNDCGVLKERLAQVALAEKRRRVAESIVVDF